MPKSDTLRQSDSLRHYYQNKAVSREYVANRFQHALGRVLHEKQVRVVNRTIAEHNCEKLLELACGPARLTIDVAGGDHKVAVDGSEAMLAEAGRRLRARNKQNCWSLEKADIFNLDLKKKFDLIYSFRFIRHFQADDRKRIYSVIKKHLVPRGLVAFDVVNREVSEPVRLREGSGNYNIYDKLYSEAEFRAEISEQEWQLINLIPVQPHYEWLRKLQIYLAPRNNWLAYSLMKWIENNTTANPLEWIAVCKCE